MTSIVIKAKNKKDIEFLIMLSKRMNFETTLIKEEELEDLIFGVLMQKAKKGKHLTMDTIYKELDK